MTRPERLVRGRLEQARANLEMTKFEPTDSSTGAGTAVIGTTDSPVTRPSDPEPPAGLKVESVLPVPSRAVPDRPVLLSQKAAAHLFGVTTRTIRTWTKKGKLRAVRVEGRIYYLQADIDVICDAGTL